MCWTVPEIEACKTRKMGRKGKETTEAEITVIIRLHNQCKSLTRVSKIVGRLKAIIQHIIDRVGEKNH